MKCYNHADVDAVGTCKTCYKGICHSCLTDVGNGIACTATCVEEVKEINSLIERNKNIYKKASKTNTNRGYLYTGIGLIFILINYQLKMDDAFLFVIGITMVVLGLYSLYSGYTQKNK